jgi:spermidine/putrescine transport system permease protein
LRTSLLVALAATAISLALGTAAALALDRRRSALRKAAEGLIVLPVIVPEIIIGFAAACFFGLLGMRLGLGTVVAAHVAFSISYVVFVVRARLGALDPSLEEAAMDLGATPWQTFLRVTLPALLPAIVSAALLVFTISLDDYVITSFVAGPGATTLPLRIYSMVKTGVTPEINAISGLLLAVTVVLVFLSERISSGRVSTWTRAAGIVAVVLLLGFAAGGRGSGARGGELNVLIWSNYLPEDVIRDFERSHDCRLRVELYDSNEAALAKLESGAATYDIVVPSDYMVSVLAERGLLQDIDREEITNFSNLDPELVGLPHDPSNRYSAPYLWGTTGIGYRTDKVTEPVDSWAALWDERYKDRIAMLDDAREAFGAALKLRGMSENSRDETEIREAAELLAQQKRLVRSYDSGGFDHLLLSGDAWIVQGYNGQIAKAMVEDPRIAYVIPREGCTMSVDNLCIPAQAPHRTLAHAFINFVLGARVAARIANETGYSSPNLVARAYIRPDLLSNEAIYPRKQVLRRCEFITDIGRAVTVYDRYWTEIKSK